VSKYRIIGVKGKEGKLKLSGTEAAKTPTGTSVGDGTARREAQSARTDSMA